jgi:hypothetical protein
MTCLKNCKCHSCFTEFGNRDWVVIHSQGTIIVPSQKLDPSNALALGVALECAVRDALRWIDSQPCTEPTPETLRSSLDLIH